jgi:hypothetical protein
MAPLNSVRNTQGPAQALGGRAAFKRRGPSRHWAPSLRACFTTLLVVAAVYRLLLRPAWPLRTAADVQLDAAGEPAEEEGRQLGSGGGGGARDPAAGRGPKGERSHYLKWIRQDLSYWRARGGISRELLEAAPAQAHKCNAWIRFQILGGRLHVHHYDPGSEGFYPAGMGRGWASAKGRIPYAILALADALYHFPGELGAAGWGR